jgi:phage terminase large subunit-like protein
MKWQAKPGQKIDFDEPRAEIHRLCREFNVVMLAYDRHELHDMMSQLSKENIVWTYDFGQGSMRLEADRQLLDLILEKRYWHDGNPDVREHIDNADKKLDEDGRRLRIVKREDAMKIDLAVCASMAANRCLYLNL